MHTPSTPALGNIWYKDASMLDFDSKLVSLEEFTTFDLTA